MPGRNNFKALPIFIVLVLVSVFSVTIFQSFSVNKNLNSKGQVFGLNDEKLPFPTQPSAQILSQTDTDNRSYYTFKTSSSIIATEQWYKAELLKEGWVQSENQYIYTRGNERLELSILDNEDKTTLVMINYIY